MADARVTVRLAGGLGNQLFMWAAARRLAHVSDCPMDLDATSGFRNDFYGRDYCLEDLVGPQERCSPYRAFAGRTGRVRELAALARDRYRILPPRWITDSPRQVNERMLTERVHAPTYVRGYFQSERYFADIADDLRRQIRYRGPVSTASRALADAIASSPNPVGVHARMLYALPQIDDPVDLPSEEAARAASPFMGREYYGPAARRIAETTGEPDFFLFSDHPQYAASQLQLPGRVTVVEHNSQANAAEDLWLLSLCRHHILCGSSFGWWGAWLAEHPDQQVVVPTHGYPNREMMPARWSRAGG